MQAGNGHQVCKATGFKPLPLLIRNRTPIGKCQGKNDTLVTFSLQAVIYLPLEPFAPSWLMNDVEAGAGSNECFTDHALAKIVTFAIHSGFVELAINRLQPNLKLCGVARLQ